MKRWLGLWMILLGLASAHDVPWVHDNIPDDADGDGIADAYEKEHGLNPNHPADGEADPDLDGFTNREEFIAKTDPKNAEEFPEWFTKLYVQEIKLDGLVITMLPKGTVLAIEGGRFSWSGISYTTKGLTEDGALVLEEGKTEPRFLPARSRRVALKINRMLRAQADK